MKTDRENNLIPNVTSVFKDRYNKLQKHMVPGGDCQGSLLKGGHLTLRRFIRTNPAEKELQSTARANTTIKFYKLVKVY